MVKSLLSIINVVEGEEKPALLLLGKGFFMGVFLATYKVVATTLFLDHLETHLREAIFISGVLGVISTGLYAYIQNRIHYSKLAIFNYIFIFSFIALARMAFIYESSDWLIFTLFVMLGPITSIMVLGFWGVFLRLFDLRQSKRIIGGIDSGQLIATIIAFYTIPFLTNFITNITNFLVIGDLSLMISLAFVILIIINFNINSYHHTRDERPRESRIKNILSNKYVIFLALFLFFSMMASTFVDYSFWTVTEKQYPDERQLASFLGVFEGSIMILSLLVQTFVNDKLIKMYGLLTSLLVLPVILTAFTGLAIFSGYYYGIDITNPSFIWFFLFIALSSLFTRSLRDSIENPVFKLFFMPLDNKIRFDIQARIEGMVNEFSRAIGGAIILLLGYIPFFHLIHYSIILLLVIVGWVFLAFKIYGAYKVNIRLKLQRQKEEADKLEKKGRDLLITKLVSSAKKDKYGRSLFSLKLLAKITHDTFSKTIDMIQNEKDKDRGHFLMKKLENDYSFMQVSNLVEFTPEEIKKDSKSQDDDHINHKKIIAEIETLKFSTNPHDRKRAAELVGVKDYEESISTLIELLNDQDLGVVKAAMASASFLKKTELLPFILDNLHKKNLIDATTEALMNYGEEAFQSLESLFFSTDQHVEIKLKIIKIYGKVGGDLALEYLWNKINYPDRTVVSEVLLALSHCEFTAQPEQISQLKLAIESDISNILYNFIAIHKLKSENDALYDKLVHTLREETDLYYNHIYMLISMIYDRKSIHLVKENIESGTNEGISYALEMLDVFLSEDHKLKIIPLLEDIEDIDKVRRMEMFYPQWGIDSVSVLRQIINREFSQSSRWSKAVAIYCVVQKHETEEYLMELISNLFNPDELLCEISGWALHEYSAEIYEENVNRLDRAVKDHLNNIILGQKYSNESKLRPHMRYEMIDYIKKESVLRNLPSYIVASLVDFMEEIFLESSVRIDDKTSDLESFYLIYTGSLNLMDKDDQFIKQYKEGAFLSEQILIELIDNQRYLLVEEDVVMFKINKNKFFDLVSDDYDVTLKLVQSFEKNRRKKSMQGDNLVEEEFENI